MLTVSMVANEHHHYFPLNYWSQQPMRIGPVPGFPVSIGGLLLQLPAGRAHESTNTSVNIPFGYMIEGTKTWGTMRDKDVQHLSAHGTIVCGGPGLTGTPVPNVGQHYVGGGLDFIAEAIVPWGETVEISGYYPMLDYVSTNLGRITSNGQYWHTQGVYFGADDAVYIFTTHSIRIDYLDQGFGFTTQPSSTAVFLHRDPATGVLSNSGIQYADGAQIFHLPGGSVTVEQLKASPGAWGVGVGPSSVYTDVPDTEGDAQADFDTIVADLRSGAYAQRIFRIFESTRNLVPDIGTLAEDICLQQKYVKGDVLLTVFDLVMSKEQFEAWKQFRISFPHAAASLAFQLRHGDERKDFAHITRVLQQYASIFLGAKYGLAPNYGDMVKMFNGLKKNFVQYVHHSDPSRYHARRTSSQPGPFNASISTTLTMKVEVQQWPRGIIEDYMREIRDLKRWGLYPNLRMALDVLKYSFVLDWVINLGNTFKQIDTAMDQQYFPLTHVCTGSKRVFAPSASALWPNCSSASGVVNFTYYIRENMKELPLPPFTVGWGDGPWKHWAEATALIVQRRR